MTEPAGTTQQSMLSVVIPARNSAPWIGELLESLLDQDMESAEYIVVDNGSTDETSSIVRSMAAADPRIRLVLSSASSAAGARNEGVSLAEGEYLAFADSDDLVPNGAHRALLDSLSASGSDMAIGDHLKFSPTRTWSPTERWHAFAEGLLEVRPEEVPELISGRACWNRMFRREFWDRAVLAFPEIPSVDDIEPMTRAFAAAERIDVVDRVVYLYRDRDDGHAISKRADLPTTIRYLQQEMACAALVRDSPVLAAVHASVVLDADGWAHLVRFAHGERSDADVESLRAHVDDLLAAISLEGLRDVAPTRRLFWSLVLDGRLEEALSFAAASGDEDGTRRLGAWGTGISVLSRSSHPAVDVPALVRDGLLPALVNDADTVGERQISLMLSGLDGVACEEPASGLLAAMLAALRSGSAEHVVQVSALRHTVPLVVDRVDAGPAALDITGPLRKDAPRRGLAIVLVSDSREVSGVISADDLSDRWSATVVAGRLAPGRWQVGVRLEGLAEVFPVVTARMPLPPLDAEHLLQPLADRKDGWRFLVDRRQDRRLGIRGVLDRVRRRLP